MNYSAFGFKSALDSGCNPEGLTNYLDGIYDLVTDPPELSLKEQNEINDSIKLELDEANTKKEKLTLDIEHTQQAIDQSENITDRLEIKQIELEQGQMHENNSSFFPFAIAIFVTLCMTLYLFLFYSSTGYATIYGVNELGVGFINPDVIGQARNMGGGALAFVILFPIVFIGVGFFLHISLERNKWRELNHKKKNYLQPILILTAAFIVDVLIGYTIAHKMYDVEFNKGARLQEWQSSMFISDANFYLVLFLGFAVYILWGFLLHFIMSHPIVKGKDELLKSTSKQLKNKKENLNHLKDRMVFLNSDLNSTENTIKKNIELLQHLDLSEHTAVHSPEQLKKVTNEFMAGYRTYVKNAINSLEQREKIKQEINTIYQNWLAQKTHLLSKNSTL